MDVHTSHGFRVLVKVDSIKEEVMKCFIYVNSKKMKLIKDVEEHIKSILDLKVVTLYVNDAWLPSNETIKIIKEEDIIVVKSIDCPEIFHSTSKMADHDEVKRKRRKKDKDEDSSNLSLSLLQKELEVKRNELLQKHDKNTTELDLSNDFETYDDLNTFLSPPKKKKRSRKHKKKSTTKNTTPLVTLKLSSNGHHSNRKTKLSYSGVHTRFADGKEEDSAEEPLEEGDKPVAIESSAVVRKLENTDNGNINECLTKETVKPVEPYLNAHISNKSENSHNMDLSDQAATDQLNTNNETEALMSLYAENGHPGKICEVTTAEEGNQDSEQLEDNWKTKLLSLINKDLESKVFHRKFPTDVIQSC